ncbi:MAG: hypothetical protein KatS3mg050_1262 [Litorilinea sp.]|nr:MAG: hypothetical protein KatS3mg050_1262 [Litorilinea sp.]
MRISAIFTLPTPRQATLPAALGRDIQVGPGDEYELHITGLVDRWNLFSPIPLNDALPFQLPGEMAPQIGRNSELATALDGSACRGVEEAGVVEFLAHRSRLPPGWRRPGAAHPGPADGAILRQKEGGGQGLHSQKTPERNLSGRGKQREETRGRLGGEQERVNGLHPCLLLIDMAPAQREAGGHGAQIPVGKTLQMVPECGHGDDLGRGKKSSLTPGASGRIISMAGEGRRVKSRQIVKVWRGCVVHFTAKSGL